MISCATRKVVTRNFVYCVVASLSPGDVNLFLFIPQLIFLVRMVKR
jgi:hypothetical protein